MAPLTLEDPRALQPPMPANPESRASLALGFEIPLVVVMTLFVAARILVRWRKKILGLDDWIMLCAWTIATAMTVLNCVATRYGMGLHIWEYNWDYRHLLSMLGLSWQILFVPCVGLTKLAVCLSYLRLFPFRTNRIFCYCTIIFVLCWTCAVFFGSIFQCRPISKTYIPAERSCINQKTFFIATAALNSFTDLLVFLWPAKYVWNIQLPKNQRKGLLLSFTIGVLVCVAGGFKLWYLEIFYTTVDITWESAVLVLITAIEVDLGIVCGCIPFTRPLFSSFFSYVRNKCTKQLSGDTRSFTLGSFIRGFSVRIPTDVSVEVAADHDLVLTAIHNDAENSVNSSQTRHINIVTGENEPIPLSTV